MTSKWCCCGLAHSDHQPWCDYFEPAPMPVHPVNKDSWDLYDNPKREAYRYLKASESS